MLFTATVVHGKFWAYWFVTGGADDDDQANLSTFGGTMDYSNVQKIKCLRIPRNGKLFDAECEVLLGDGTFRKPVSSGEYDFGCSLAARGLSEYRSAYKLKVLTISLSTKELHNCGTGSPEIVIMAGSATREYCPDYHPDT